MWPSLLAHDKPFLTSMITPIVKVSKGKSVKSFYTLTDYRAWQEGTKDYKKWSVKYYKGLGTSSANEAREYFKSLKISNYHFTEESNQTMELAFSKQRTDERKEWLYAYDVENILDHGETEVPVQDFINRELIHFSNLSLIHISEPTRPY